MRKTSLWSALVMALALVTAPTDSALAADSPLVVFEGKLQDARRKPVGGVFPLTFSLHQSARGGKSLWTESQFVAVDSGIYQVELGTRRPIPPGLDLQRIYLAVSITGGDEIVREQLDPKAVRSGAAAAPTARTERPGAAGGGKVVDYAETAGLAYEAEHAKVADRIGNLGIEDLEEKLKQSGSRANIGSKSRYSAPAGGEGGVQYELKCPKGYVVTGVRGGSGIYLDSIQLICSPLE